VKTVKEFASQRQIVSLALFLMYRGIGSSRINYDPILKESGITFLHSREVSLWGDLGVTAG